MPQSILDLTGEGPSNGGAMLGAIRRYEWDRSPAGPIDAWPEPLRHAVRLMLLSAAPMAVLIGREGLLLFNDATLELFGPRWRNALGRSINEALPEVVPLCREAIARCFEGESLYYLDKPLILDRDGAQGVAWFNLAFTPVANAQGDVSGILLMIGRTSGQVETLRQLRRAGDHMEITLNAGGVVGMWDLDVRTNRLTSDERFAHLFALDPQVAQQGVDNDMLVDMIHPDDRAVVRACLARSIHYGIDYRCRYRMIPADGAPHWYLDVGRAILDESGAIIRLCGVVTDLTSQITVEEALADTARRFRTLVEAIPQIVWSCDGQGRHDYFNPRWHEFTGLETAGTDGTIWERLVHPEDWPQVSKCWAECLATGKPYDIEYRFLHHCGQYRWQRVMALPVRDDDGAITRWYGTATDIDENKNLEIEHDLIVNELDHRINNLFALVNGLVMLSLREMPGMEPLVEPLRGRLEALHKAHRHLRPRWNDRTDGPQSLQALLDILLRPYEDGQGRILIEGDDIALRAKSITPFALIFHELATNSAKYGALGNPGSIVHITSAVRNGHIRIDWRETGVCVAEPRSEKSGFGSRLLVLTIEKQLRGSFTLCMEPDGLSISMTIPVL